MTAAVARDTFHPVSQHTGFWEVLKHLRTRSFERPSRALPARAPAEVMLTGRLMGDEWGEKENVSGGGISYQG